MTFQEWCNLPENIKLKEENIDEFIQATWQQAFIEGWASTR